MRCLFADGKATYFGVRRMGSADAVMLPTYLHTSPTGFVTRHKINLLVQ